MSSATAESTSLERIDSLTEQNKKPDGEYARWRAEIVLAEKEVDC